mmetsp:Transcript_15279/g.25440  ORF Transcript_15279/g.25440 Transcript_15279/m.25440 type:complete len:205 (-) Transcript_15279:590-1204(-)
MFPFHIHSGHRPESHPDTLSRHDGYIYIPVHEIVLLQTHPQRVIHLHNQIVHVHGAFLCKTSPQTYHHWGNGIVPVRVVNRCANHLDIVDHPPRRIVPCRGDDSCCWCWWYCLQNHHDRHHHFDNRPVLVSNPHTPKILDKCHLPLLSCVWKSRCCCCCCDKSCVRHHEGPPVGPCHESGLVDLVHRRQFDSRLVSMERHDCHD